MDYIFFQQVEVCRLGWKAIFMVVDDFLYLGRNFFIRIQKFIFRKNMFKVRGIKVFIAGRGDESERICHNNPPNAASGVED
jgi:hypothetical protein